MLITCGIFILLDRNPSRYFRSSPILSRTIMKAALLSIVTLAIAMISLAEAQVPSGQPGPGVPVNPGYGAPGYGYGAPPPKVEILRIVSSVVSYLTTVRHSNLDFLDVFSGGGRGRKLYVIPASSSASATSDGIYYQHQLSSKL